MRCAHVVRRGGPPLLLAVTALVAGCGVDTTTADTVVPTTTTTVPASTTTLPGDPIADIRVRDGAKKVFCGNARIAHSRLSAILGGKNTTIDNEAGWREVDAQLRSLLGEVPPVLLDDAVVIAGNMVAYLRLVQRHSWDMATLSAQSGAVDEIVGLVDDDAVADATEAFERYMRNKCKIKIGE